MKKILFLLAVLLWEILCAEAQVSTHIFESKDAFKQFSELKQRESVVVSVKQMQAVNTEALLKEDGANASMGVPFRFGYGFDVNYTMDDGIWEERSSVRVWSMKVISKGAYSINFIFSDMVLSPEAELYIYNPEGLAVYGPVTSAQNADVFLTDLVAGDEAVIQLTEPVGATERSSLKISRVVHGYVNMFPFSADGRAATLTCYNDVACYPEWLRESEGVALYLLSGGTSLCTGSLLNNTSEDFKSYFLTAFHCIDTDIDGNISVPEQSNAGNGAFRFRYKREYCGGSYVTNYFTYNQAQFRAARFETDFALMEIAGNNISRDPRVSFLGWNRTTNVPASGTDIHHPAGEVMKISFDNNPLVSHNDFINWYNNNGILIGTSPPNTHWKAVLDNGSVEGGSSGSPLFDSDKRVVGQLHGVYNVTCNSPITYYGRFDLSWSGGGTNATRLSNWLDPASTGATTTNTIKYPSVSGSSYFCTTTTYQIKDLPPGANVSIQVYPPEVTASLSNDTTIVLNANGNALTGWLYVNISKGSLTYPVDTFRFITGEYYPDIQIYNDSDCCDEEYGRTGEGGMNTSGVTPRPSYDWCYNQLDRNKIKVYFYDERYRKILSSNLSYQVRLVRMSNQQVVYTYCCNYSGTDPLVIDYAGSPGIYYVVEMKIVSSDCPNASAWTSVGETFYTNCAGCSGGGIGEFRIERQSDEDFFTLKRHQRTDLLQSEKFTVRLYSLPLGRLVRESEVEIAGETVISLDGLPAGEYIVQIRRSNGECVVDPPERIIIK
ncbi:MAG: T9SS type A sorting domain-containing protein [Tannerella sp.]|jgi:hypothetical protein|nr:T9SS type A sorting domain-containing protein [Tannerella sp.]